MVARGGRAVLLPRLLPRMGGLCPGRAGLREPHPRGDGRHLQRAANLLAHPAGQGGRLRREPPARRQAAGHLPDRGGQGDRQAQSRRRRPRQGRHGDNQGRQGVLQSSHERGDPPRHGHQPQNHQTAGDGAPLRRHQGILPGSTAKNGSKTQSATAIRSSPPTPPSGASPSTSRRMCGKRLGKPSSRRGMP